MTYGANGALWALDSSGMTALVEAGVTALAGTALGWWLADRSAMARARADARAAARQALARLHQLVWPPTRYPEFLTGLDALDAELLVARVSPGLRAAVSLVASECWADGAEARGQPAPGISTELLVAFRLVRNGILSELAAGRRRRGAAERANAIFEEVEMLVRADREDRGRRTPPLVAAALAAQTLDDENE
jgi:hypothetical protein